MILMKLSRIIKGNSECWVQVKIVKYKLKEQLSFVLL